MSCCSQCPAELVVVAFSYLGALDTQWAELKAPDTSLVVSNRVDGLLSKSLVLTDPGVSVVFWREIHGFADATATGDARQTTTPAGLLSCSRRGATWLLRA
jgi:hypothetical protein